MVDFASVSRRAITLRIELCGTSRVRRGDRALRAARRRRRRAQRRAAAAAALASATPPRCPPSRCDRSGHCPSASQRSMPGLLRHPPRQRRDEDSVRPRHRARCRLCGAGLGRLPAPAAVRRRRPRRWRSSGRGSWRRRGRRVPPHPPRPEWRSARSPSRPACRRRPGSCPARLRRPPRPPWSPCRSRSRRSRRRP